MIRTNTARRTKTLLAAVAMSALAAACGDSATPGMTDSGPPVDAAGRDASSMLVDAAPRADADLTDAGARVDSSVAVDTGTVDAAVLPDAGSAVESGTPATGFTAMSISSSNDFTCAIRAGGAAFCWGDNRDGAIGDGTMTRRLVPTPVMGLTDALRLGVNGAGSRMMCAVRTGGTVSCWGIGFLGATTSAGTSAIPVMVAGITDGVSVSSGGGAGHSCLTHGTGIVACWGTPSGALGDSSGVASRGTPFEGTGITDASRVIVIASGSSCALRPGGTVSCFGSDMHGILGDGTATTTGGHAPVTVSGVTDAMAIAGGLEHVCVLRTGGAVACWGRNMNGNLGDGTTMSRDAPVPVMGLTDAIAITAGNTHSCAIRMGGQAVCWGGNSAGGLGDGTLMQRTTPVPVMGLTDAVAISAGRLHTCAIRSSGQVVCWGSNTAGQAGNGMDSTIHLTPVDVSSPL